MDHLTIGQVTFAEPRFLALLAAAPLALLIVALGALGRRRAARRFGAVGVPVRNGRRLLSSAVVILALALMAVAAARPQWGERPATFRREGIDLAVALDVSLSMLTRDVEPSRLERAKDEIDRLFGSLRGDRVALVTFAGDAIVRFPLTTDIDVARQLMRATAVDTALRPGTNVASAVNAARAAFLNDRSTTKVLLLVTDGEQELPGGTAVGDAQLEIERAKGEGIRVIVVGAGTDEGGRIPIRSTVTGEQTFKIDADTGRPVVSRLDERFLRALAEKAGGEYVRLDGSSGLGAVSDRLAQLQASAFFEDTEQRAVERFQWFVAAALALLVLPTALGRLFTGDGGAGRRAALAGTLAAALFLVACGEDAALRLNREGNDAYARGDYAGALQKYRQAQVKRPDLPELNYNAANVLFRTKDMDRAIEEVQRALNSSDPDLLGRAYYSLGNFYATLDRWQEARAAYRNSLVQNPSDVDAKYNLEVANRRIAPPPQATPPGAQGSPTATPTARPGATPSASPSATPGATATGEPGGAGRPLPGGTPQADGGENPSNISPQEERALREALGKLDPGQPYDIEEALRILETLRRARESRASGLPAVPVEGRRDW